VLALGNPVSKLRVWELYKSQISRGENPEPEVLTTIRADKTVYDYGSIQKNKTYRTVFTITNTGKKPLVIHRVSASCGCTNMNWEKQPVKPGKATGIQVEMTPEETGYFNKSIHVFCNSKKSPLKLTITGTVEDNGNF